MIDTHRIQELEQEIGQDDLGVVLEMFLSEAEKTIDTIAEGLADADHARATHFLRSGALNIGLVGFAAAADTAAREPQEMRSASAGALKAVLSSSVSELRQCVPAL